jgi:DNA invertase Pin-like site-specific DNA recombinase
MGRACRPPRRRFKTGKKKGPGKSGLDPYKEEIVALLRNGSPKNFVAKSYGVSEPTLYNYIEKHHLDVEPRLERAI